MTNISSYYNNARKEYIYKKTMDVSGASFSSGASAFCASGSSVSQELRITDLAMSEIVELFTTGNLTASELKKWLEAPKNKNKVSEIKTETKNNVITFNFKYNNKQYTISCAKDAAASQTDKKYQEIKTVSELKTQGFTGKDITKYFIQVSNYGTAKYALKPDCGYKTISALAKAVKEIHKQEFQEAQSNLIMQNFLNGNVTYTTSSGKVYESATILKKTSDGTTITKTNYEKYAAEISKATGGDIDKLKREALAKFKKDFATGNVAYSQAFTILNAIGVKNYTHKLENGNYVLTFDFEGESYSITCNEKAAKSGVDNIKVKIYKQKDVNKFELKKEQIQEFFEIATDINGTKTYRLKEGITEEFLETQSFSKMISNFFAKSNSSYSTMMSLISLNTGAKNSYDVYNTLSVEAVQQLIVDLTNMINASGVTEETSENNYEIDSETAELDTRIALFKQGLAYAQEFLADYDNVSIASELESGNDNNANLLNYYLFVANGGDKGESIDTEKCHKMINETAEDVINEVTRFLNNHSINNSSDRKGINDYIADLRKNPNSTTIFKLMELLAPSKGSGIPTEMNDRAVLSKSLYGSYYAVAQLEQELGNAKYLNKDYTLEFALEQTLEILNHDTISESDFGTLKSFTDYFISSAAEFTEQNKVDCYNTLYTCVSELYEDGFDIDGNIKGVRYVLSMMLSVSKELGLSDRDVENLSHVKNYLDRYDDLSTDGSQQELRQLKNYMSPEKFCDLISDVTQNLAQDRSYYTTDKKNSIEDIIDTTLHDMVYSTSYSNSEGVHSDNKYAPDSISSEIQDIISSFVKYDGSFDSAQRLVNVTEYSVEILTLLNKNGYTKDDIYGKDGFVANGTFEIMLSACVASGLFSYSTEEIDTVLKNAKDKKNPLGTVEDLHKYVEQKTKDGQSSIFGITDAAVLMYGEMISSTVQEKIDNSMDAINSLTANEEFQQYIENNLEGYLRGSSKAFTLETFNELFTKLFTEYVDKHPKCGIEKENVEIVASYLGNLTYISMMGEVLGLDENAEPDVIQKEIDKYFKENPNSTYSDFFPDTRVSYAPSRGGSGQRRASGGGGFFGWCGRALHRSYIWARNHQGFLISTGASILSGATLGTFAPVASGVCEMVTYTDVFGNKHVGLNADPVGSFIVGCVGRAATATVCNVKIFERIQDISVSAGSAMDGVKSLRDAKNAAQKWSTYLDIFTGYNNGLNIAANVAKYYPGVTSEFLRYYDLYQKGKIDKNDLAALYPDYQSRVKDMKAMNKAFKKIGYEYSYGDIKTNQFGNALYEIMCENYSMSKKDKEALRKVLGVQTKEDTYNSIADKYNLSEKQKSDLEKCKTDEEFEKCLKNNGIDMSDEEKAKYISDLGISTEKEFKPESLEDLFAKNSPLSPKQKEYAYELYNYKQNDKEAQKYYMENWELYLNNYTGLRMAGFEGPVADTILSNLKGNNTLGYPVTQLFLKMLSSGKMKIQTQYLDAAGNVHLTFETRADRRDKELDEFLSDEEYDKWMAETEMYNAMAMLDPASPEGQNAWLEWINRDLEETAKEMGMEGKELEDWVKWQHSMIPFVVEPIYVGGDYYGLD